MIRWGRIGILGILGTLGLGLALGGLAQAQVVPPLNPGEEPSVSIQFKDTPLETVLDLYGELTGKSIMMSPAVAQVNITFKTRRKISSREALIAIETMLSMNQITIVPFRRDFVRVFTIQEAIQKVPIENLPKEDTAP